MQKLHLTEGNSLGLYINHQKEPLLVAVKNNKTIRTEEATTPMVYKQNERCRVDNSWTEKIMHGQYLRYLDGKDSLQPWQWLKDTDLKGCTEALICSVQEQAIRTNNANNIKLFINKTRSPPPL